MIPPPGRQAAALDRLARLWADLGGEASPFVSRLDVAADLAWPAPFWPGLRASLAGRMVSGRTTSITEQSVAWLRPSGPRIIIYQKTEGTIRVEVALNGAKQMERFLPDLAKLDLGHLRTHTDVICKAVLSKALGLLSLDQAAPEWSLSAERVLEAARENPGRALTCLGFQAATWTAGPEALKEAIPDRTYRRMKAHTEALLGNLEQPGPALSRAVVEVLADPINGAARQISDILQARTEYLLSALGRHVRAAKEAEKATSDLEGNEA